MSAGNIDDLMDLWSSYSSDLGSGDAPFRNNKDFLRTIDSISLGDVPWKCFKVRYDGDVPDFGYVPSWTTREHHVYYRNPLEIVHNILANQDYKDGFDYAPFREFRDEKRRWTDVMSGNWAWKQAVSVYILCAII